MKKLIIFDLDGTLADSTAVFKEEMDVLLRNLLTVNKVAVIPGGDWLFGVPKPFFVLLKG
nr:hypothetical protein [Mucilaginibacter sp. L294]